jgi:hypothetical protein
MRAITNPENKRSNLLLARERERGREDERER